MESGEARPIVILENAALGRFSFLIAMLEFSYYFLSENLKAKPLLFSAFKFSHLTFNLFKFQIQS
jgi:hypothetical protein